MPDVELILDGTRYACTLAAEPDAWAFPVGEQGYPPERWYCATWHDPTGKLNKNGYEHTGIDLNLDISPRGDIERLLGLSVYALAFGLVTFVTQNWYGVPMVVIRHEHEGAPLYTRYAHIIPAVKLGDTVHAGDKLGAFADWRTGDHLHLDMSRTAYTTKFFTPGMLGPLPVLRAHLDPERVAAMVARG